MTEIIHGEEAVKVLHENRNKQLQVSLRDLFTKKREKIEFDAGDNMEKVEIMFGDIIAKEVFEGRISETLTDEERDAATEGHLFGQVEVNGEPKDLVVKYYLDSKYHEPYFISAKFKALETAYA
jgi:hypothetical protein